MYKHSIGESTVAPTHQRHGGLRPVGAAPDSGRLCAAARASLSNDKYTDCENPCIRPNPCLPLCQLFEAARIEQRDERAVDLEQACGAELVDDFGNGLAVGVDPLGELAVAAARQA